MSASLRFATTSITHPGVVRTANEDSFASLEDRGLWAVADGMGGYAFGQWASTTVVSAIQAAALTGAFDADLAALSGAIHQANASIYSASQQQGRPMGSTAAALYLNDDQFACVWAGDSRIYLLRAGVLHRMTRDHTQVQEMIDRGMLTPEEGARHPMSHVLSRAVGVQPTLDLDAVRDQAKAGDIFLICSDGLSGVVSEPEICERLASLPREAACRRLVELCLSRGAPDNLTIVAVACEEKTTLTLSPASAL